MLQARARWEDVSYAVARCTDTLKTCPTSGMSAMSAVMVEPGLCFIGKPSGLRCPLLRRCSLKRRRERMRRTSGTHECAHGVRRVRRWSSIVRQQRGWESWNVETQIAPDNEGSLAIMPGLINRRLKLCNPPNGFALLLRINVFEEERCNADKRTVWHPLRSSHLTSSRYLMHQRQGINTKQ